MFVYQDGKLYAMQGDKLVGVNISPTGLVTVAGIETSLGSKYELLTLRDVMLKFNMAECNTHVFHEVKTEAKNEEVTEVATDGQAKPVKRTTRKSTSK